MKKNLNIKLACLAAIGMALVWAGGVARANTVTNWQTALTASGSAWWINGWGGQAGASTYDGTTGNPAGSMHLIDNLPGGDQFVMLGWYSGGSWYDPTGGSTNLLLYTNVVLDVLWDPANSTMEISQFNSTGEYGVRVWAIGAGNSWIDMGNIVIPDTASNGWVTLKMPIIPTISGISTTWGLGFKKWTGSGNSTIASFWVDNIGLEQELAPPPKPIIDPLSKAAVQGLNIYDDGGQWDRQNIATVVTNAGPDYNYSWIDSATPVSYAYTIATFPQNASYQTHIMLSPGNDVNDVAPDWNQSDSLVWFVARQGDGSVIGSLRYKLGNPNNNTYLFGSDTNIFGGSGSAVTNTIVAGYGGLLGNVTNTGTAIGTWKMTFSDNTNVTVQTADGTTASFAFPQLSDAQVFTGPVTVYWGTQPNTASLVEDVVYTSVSITGGTNTLSVDLTQPLDSSRMKTRASNPSFMFNTPTNAVYWIQWNLPDVDYVLQGASDLLGPWTKVGPPVNATNYLNTFDDVYSFTNTRTYNPPPMWVGYDFGNATASSVVWASSPTNALQLDWTWNYTANGAGPAAFTMDLFAAGVNCSGGTLSFNIMIDPSSTAGGSGDYGYLQVISRDGGYGWNDTGYGSGLLAAAGGSTGNWGPVSIPLGTGAASTVRALTFQFYNDAGRAIDGPETVYIDNLKITVVGIGNPTIYTIGGKHSMFITTDYLPSTGTGFFRLARPY